jgi:hypothetical protein
MPRGQAQQSYKYQVLVQTQARPFGYIKFCENNLPSKFYQGQLHGLMSKLFVLVGTRLGIFGAS